MTERGARRAVRWAALAGALWMAGAADLFAQFGGGGFGRLDPAKREAAWALESQTVARILGLDGGLTDKLAAAYKAARESHLEAVTKLRETAGDDRMAMMQAMAELSDGEKGKLQTAIKAFLNEEQTAKAVGSLGAFSGEWDTMADALAGYGLAPEKLSAALGPVHDYVVDVTKAMDEARASFDFQGMRTAREEAKAKLDEALGKILTPEQMTQWTEATARRGRGGPGGGRGPGQP